MHSILLDLFIYLLLLIFVIFLIISCYIKVFDWLKIKKQHHLQLCIVSAPDPLDDNLQKKKRIRIVGISMGYTLITFWNLNQ